ncbi:ATP-binding protein [Ectothiorhodospira marina]|uniref:histidine kinase n=1 Tax=Ectothiorhodospira marina TaxID=1396821 RepID=A0A1H7KP05_9GAMM|nr:ATP-binding protein [Ectothiorhodospira marina]SEK87775.1 two-component system, NarL family, sensor histidine kinase BarA [Ectothiorhodospira marina]
MQGRIRYRILTLSLLPSLAVALALTLYWTDTKVRELDAQLTLRGEMLAAFLAPAAEYGVISGNQNYLEAITAKARMQPDVLVVSIRDHQGHRVYHHEQRPDASDPDSPMAWMASQLFGEEVRHFQEEIRLTALDEFDLPLPDASQAQGQGDPRLIGSISLSLTNVPTTVHQTHSMLQSLMIALLLLAATWVLVSRWSMRLSTPLEKIAATVKYIDQGDLTARSRARVGGEIGVLQAGINSMAESIERSQQSMSERILQATQRLQEKLDEIDEKNHALTRARGEADQANRRKSEFLASISHELRTPLTAVQGYAELLIQRGTLDEQERAWVNIIDESSQDTLKLVSDLLDISRIESGNVYINRTAFNLRQLLGEVISVCDKAVPDRTVNITLLMEPGTTEYLISDPLRVKQLLTNVLSNAVKFTLNGHVILRVRIRGEQGTLLEMEVQDFGPGIDETQLERIFEPFYQVQPDNAQRVGSGLGLGITRGLINVLGGQISVNSRPGKGATFRLKVPVETTDAPTRLSRPKPMAGGLVILADDMEARDLALACGRRQGLQAWPVDGIKGLLDALGASDEHRGLIWLRRPDAETLRALRQHPQRAHQMILVAFASLPEDLTAEWRRRGALVVAPQLSEGILRDHLLRHGNDSERSFSSERHRMARPGPRSISGKRILIADDNAINRRLLTEFVNGMGGLVDEAANGRQAVESYRARRCDIVFMDVHMPVLDGPGALRLIRREDPGARIIAVTADARPEFHGELLEMGFDRILTKPVSQHDLLDCVQKATDDPPTVDTAPHAHPLEIPPGGPLHDPERALRMAGDSPELAMELRQLLIRDLGRARQELCDTGLKRPALLKLAHQLKGASRYCATPRLEAASTALEKALRESDEVSIPGLRQTLLVEVEALLSTWNNVISLT